MCYEHLQKKHPECKKPFSCAKCPKRFANDYSLKKHQRTHLPRSLQTLLRCAHCKKTFHSNNSLNIHIRAVHEKELPFICQDCGKGFFSSHVLKEHQVIHSDDLPFACTVCQKRFKLKRRLKFHMETHSDQTFDCPKCDAKLSSSHVLRQHMVVHSDERKYSCEICGKAFKRQHDCKVIGFDLIPCFVNIKTWINMNFIAIFRYTQSYIQDRNHSNASGAKKRLRVEIIYVIIKHETIQLNCGHWKHRSLSNHRRRLHPICELYVLDRLFYRN